MGGEGRSCQHLRPTPRRSPWPCPMRRAPRGGPWWASATGAGMVPRCGHGSDPRARVVACLHLGAGAPRSHHDRGPSRNRVWSRTRLVHRNEVPRCRRDRLRGAFGDRHRPRDRPITRATRPDRDDGDHHDRVAVLGDRRSARVCARPVAATDAPGLFDAALSAPAVRSSQPSPRPLNSPAPAPSTPRR